jgi:regulator of sigma E protease
MSIIITLVAFFVILVLLILAHEAGHFLTARAFGVKIDEFGLGYPPRLYSVRRGETLYSLNALPLGGFVKLAGEEDPKIPLSLASKNAGLRILILSSGALVNAILPIILFAIAFMVPHDVLVGKVLVKEIAPDSPAAVAGITPGDMVLSVNDQPVNNLSDMQRYLQLHLGGEITMQVRHPDATTSSKVLTPRWKPPPGQGATGITMELQDSAVVRRNEPIWTAVPLGARQMADTFVLFKNGIESMIIGATPAAFTGPVGIAQVTGEVAQNGISSLLEWTAFLSINLAIVNILPFPALDGGRILFVLMELVRRGKRIPAKVEGMVHFIGFTILIAAVVYITSLDVIRLVTGGNLS